MDSEHEVKAETLRMLDPRWHWYRAVLLRETGFTWLEIAEALDRHFTTVQKYYKYGVKELEVEGTLHFYLSDRTRKLLQHYEVGTCSSCAPQQALPVARSYFENKRLKGVGRGTALEILNAIDCLHESRAHRHESAGE